MVQRVEEEALAKNSSTCKDHLIETTKYHLLPNRAVDINEELPDLAKDTMKLPKLMVMVGGQAPKSIRSVECYDS